MTSQSACGASKTGKISATFRSNIEWNCWERRSGSRTWRYRGELRAGEFKRIVETYQYCRKLVPISSFSSSPRSWSFCSASLYCFPPALSFSSLFFVARFPLEAILLDPVFLEDKADRGPFTAFLSTAGSEVSR